MKYLSLKPTLLFVLFVLILSSVVDANKYYGSYFRIGPTKHENLKTNEAFSVCTVWKIEKKTSSISVDISLPVGVTLLSGDLHWQTAVVQHESYDKYCSVVIDGSGIFVVPCVFNAVQCEDSSFARSLPIHDTLFFASREDTVAYFDSQQKLDQYIRDSAKYFPRVHHRKTNLQFEIHNFKEQADSIIGITNGGPFNRIFSIFSLYALTFPDSNYRASLPDTFSQNQLERIHTFLLIFSPPDQTRIANLCNSIFQRVNPNLALDKRERFINAVQLQLDELFVFDRQIIIAENSTVVDSLNLKRFGRILLRFSKLCHEEKW